MKALVLVILASLSVPCALAGTNTLPIETGMVIQRSHVNKFQTALVGDLVPRNSSGVPQASSGALGTAAFPWTTTYTRDLNLFGLWNGNAITLAPPSPLPTPYVLTFPSALPSVQTPVMVGTDGGLGFRRPAKGSAYSGTDTVFVCTETPTNALTVNLTTSGGAVMVNLQPDETADLNKAITAGSGASTMILRIVRGSTTLSEEDFGVTSDMRPLTFLDPTPSAGTHSYHLQVNRVGGSGCAQLRRVRMHVVELL